jgi:CxxC motif-containing protein (DUF1111 family)
MRLAAIAVAVAILGGCSGGGPAPRVGQGPGRAGEVLASAESGGATTVFDVTMNAFALPARNLGAEERRAFAVGNNFFNDAWVIAPASTTGRDGLGPTFNATSCSGCHLRDGRGAPAAPGDNTPGLLFRVSVPGTGARGEPKPEPTYSDQVQDRAVPGVPAEGHVETTYEEVPGRMADGTPYSLARPTYRFVPALGPVAPGTMLSPRVAPALVGMGLLEAIPEADVLARADPDDKDGDGVSGRPNRVWNSETERAELGRFGWKANQPTVSQQVAGAFLGDLGITSRLAPAQNCPEVQTACAAAPDGGQPELDDQKLDRVTFYSRTLAVPARRKVDEPDQARGAQLFASTGCTACHTASARTGSSDIPALAHQDIQPFTDLLLHDMGPELADGRPDFEASGSEWRTPPLWGIGLVSTVNRHTRFLHDGRARSLEEAVLWHGGEGEGARRRYTELPAGDRAALLAFLGSL